MEDDAIGGKGGGIDDVSDAADRLSHDDTEWGLSDLVFIPEMF